MGSEMPEGLVKVGQKIGDFTMTDPDGKSVTLKEVSGEAGIVVGFLHGTYCPHCIQQLNRSNRIADRLREHGVGLAWVLQDNPSSITAYRLAAYPPPRFIMLADSEPSVGQHFGIPEEEQAFQPSPVVFYIDAEGTVRHVEKRENPHAPPNIEDVLEAAHKSGDAPEGG